MIDVDGSCIYPDGAFCIAEQEYIVDMDACPYYDECTGACYYYMEKDEVSGNDKN